MCTHFHSKPSAKQRQFNWSSVWDLLIVPGYGGPEEQNDQNKQITDEKQHHFQTFCLN